MKRCLVVLSLFIISCSSTEGPQNTIPEVPVIEDPTEVPSIGENESPVEDEPKGDDSSSEEVLKISFPSTWVSDSSVQVRFVEDKGNKYIVLGSEVGIIGESIKWIYSDTREGGESSYSLTCSTNFCGLVVDGVSYSLSFVGDWGVLPTVTINTLPVPDELVGYYTSGDISVEITKSKVIYNVGLSEFISFDLIEDMGEGSYLSHVSSSAGTNYSFSKDNGNWFTVLNIRKSVDLCDICHESHMSRLVFSFSSNFSKYRTEAKNNVEMISDIVLTSNTDCAYKSAPEFPKELEGEWFSDNGVWSLGSIIHTPYDDRPLNYLEFTECESEYSICYNMLATYGKPEDTNLNNPNRYDNIYIHGLKVEGDLDSLTVVHSLSGEGSFGSVAGIDYSTTDVLSSEEMKESVYNNLLATNSNGNRLEVEDDVIHASVYAGDLFAGSVLSYIRSEAEPNYWDDVDMLVTEGYEGAYAECTNKYTKVRLYYYPNGSTSNPDPYVILITPKTPQCFVDEDSLKEYTPSYNKRYPEYYM